MTTEGLSGAVTAQLLSATSPPAGEAGTMQQGAFQSPQSPTQLDAGIYDSPLPPTHSEQFKPVMSFAADASENLKTAMDRKLTAAGPEVSPEVQALQEVYSRMRDFQFAELQFTLIGKSLQVADRNVQVLYQQQS
jgi:hypothetical protein